jgi:hypothetical protein
MFFLNRAKGLIFCLLMGLNLYGQSKKHTDPAAGNPLLPGYFADPTVKKFGDTYYIYATTDGNGGGFGPSQVWSSKDFVNWSLQDMNWPTTHHYWAPDVTQARDGFYYMYYCQPVEIFGARSSSPTGPWTALLPDGVPVVRNFLVPDVITLDGQTFKDDDGKMYMFWGTWGIYPNHGCGVGLLNTDMKSFAKLDKIPNTVAKDFFEAPFMFKRNGIYYLTYSSGRCEDDTYRVQYAISRTGPMGPFEYGKNNPILSTSADGTVHGPGHQSVLQEGNDFYMIYHRHNNPHSGGGYHRQVAADKMAFDAEGNIEKIIPTHSGIGYLAKNSNPVSNLALKAKVSASSFYSEDFKPEFALDDNNGTLWKPRNNTSEAWLKMDLGELKTIKNIQTQFEYATWYYQYLIEYSTDGLNWAVFADRRKNTIHGSPMIDRKDVKARYLRLSILNTEYPGLNKAVWNFKVFAEDKYHPESHIVAKDPSKTPGFKSEGLLVDLDANAFDLGAIVSKWPNLGKLSGSFLNGTAQLPTVDIVAGKKAVIFDQGSYLDADFKRPGSLSGNSSFSVVAWVFNPVIEDEEPILSWTARGGVDMTNGTLGYGLNKNWGAAAHWGWADMAYKTLPAAGRWHHIALVFDGTTERLYVDGLPDREELKMLFIANLRNFRLGTTADKNAFFSGALASLKIYDVPLSLEEIQKMVKEEPYSDAAISLSPGKLNYGNLKEWKNEGYLGGSFSSTEVSPIVKDIRGRIAIDLGKKGALKFKASFPGQLVENASWIVLAKGKCFKDENWHHVVQLVQQKRHQNYIDGVLRTDVNFELLSVKNDTLFIGLDKGKNVPDAIASLTVLNRVIEAAEVKDLYQKWSSNVVAAIPGAVFSVLPKALSPHMVTMRAGTADLPGQRKTYYFHDTKGRNSGWTSEPDYTFYGLEADQAYTFMLKVRDNYGNVTAASAKVEVRTDVKQFNIFEEAFSRTVDYRLEKGLWDGFLGKADTLKSSAGVLTLSSSGTKWDGGEPQGPFMYKEVGGDFIVEAEVKDVSGLAEKKANGANDVGLMVCTSDTSFQLIQNSVFPGWGMGNMVTSLDRNGRIQNSNAAGWDFYRHLQIERRGNWFSLRGSTDGRHWKELPGSPVLRKDMDQQVLRVGLFQCTYGPQSGYGKFGHFKLIKLKE